MQGKGRIDTSCRRLEFTSGNHTAKASNQDHRVMERGRGKQGEDGRLWRESREKAGNESEENQEDIGKSIG